MNFHDELKVGSEEILGPVGILIRLPCKEFVLCFVVKLPVIFEHGNYIGLYNMKLFREEY